MKTIQDNTGADMSFVINPALQQAQQLAVNLQRSKE